MSNGITNGQAPEGVPAVSSLDQDIIDAQGQVSPDSPAVADEPGSDPANRKVWRAELLITSDQFVNLPEGMLKEFEVKPQISAAAVARLLESVVADRADLIILNSVAVEDVTPGATRTPRDVVEDVPPAPGS
jgi:hypothetical protein